MATNDQQIQQQSWKSRPTTVQLNPAYTRVYNSPSTNQQHQHYQAIQRPNPINHTPTTAGNIVYADLSISRTGTHSVQSTLVPAVASHNQNEMSPTEYAVLQFMGGGQEVQV